LTIALSVPRFAASDYPFGIFTLLTIVLSVPWFAVSGYRFGIFYQKPDIKEQTIQWSKV
jgi:hypothetical protein